MSAACYQYINAWEHDSTLFSLVFESASFSTHSNQLNSSTIAEAVDTVS